MSRFLDAVKAFWQILKGHHAEIDQNNSQNDLDKEEKANIKSKILRKHYEAGALCTLSMFQEEGRFIDFLQLDIENYDDAQIGQLVRKIHGPCRKILEDNFNVKQIITTGEGGKYLVDKKFDRSRVKLVGNVPDMVPFEGSIRHCGWEARKMNLPEKSGTSSHKVITHAEVGF